MNNQVKLIDQTKLLERLKKELELCIKEKFNEKNTRFYLGRETVLADIINQIELGSFDHDPVPTIKPGDTEAFARINATYYAEHQLFLNQRRELAEVKGREQKLKDLLLEVKRDCRPSGWYEGPIYGQVALLLSALYPEEETV